VVVTTTVLHVSPHPDDEALGAPATLLLLRAAGWHVVNAVVSLGQPGDHARRREEAAEAARRSGFELVLPEVPFVLPNDEPHVRDWVTRVLRAHAPALVVSPSLEDAHPSHEATARAVAAALDEMPGPVPWWQWGLWADLQSPTLYVPFGDDVLIEAQHVLAAYTGELARNDYSRLLEARAVANAVLGSERVFGFGTARASELPYAEVLTELTRADSSWRPGAKRLLDPSDPFARVVNR
jgi:LmbE family N-acetylglucosaminyl deacetylase